MYECSPLYQGTATAGFSDRRTRMRGGLLITGVLMNCRWVARLLRRSLPRARSARAVHLRCAGSCLCAEPWLRTSFNRGHRDMAIRRGEVKGGASWAGCGQRRPPTPVHEAGRRATARAVQFTARTQAEELDRRGCRRRDGRKQARDAPAALDLTCTAKPRKEDVSPVHSWLGSCFSLRACLLGCTWERDVIKVAA